jgi:histidinol-phosphate aminotransferase
MFNSNIESITPYTPGQSIAAIQEKYNITTIIKLASNENPLGPAATLQDISPTVEHYPDYTTHPIIPALAHQFNITPEQFILGNGSDEILQLIALAIISPGDEILSSTCTFSEYKFVAQITGAKYIEAPMTDYTYDIQALIDHVTPATKIVFIANPNNPTGTYVSHADIVALLNHLSPTTLLVLDEAYIEYSTASDYPDSLHLINMYPNVLITRTFSKIYGLAALRVGYAMANERIIQGLQKVRQPFNVNSVALDCAALALKNTSFVQASIQNNIEGRAFLTNALAYLAVTIPDAQGNFLYIDFHDFDGVALCESLLKQGIIVRSMASFGHPQAIRVTIGTPHQNKAFIKALLLCLKK